jgi:hypothetical protein
MSTNSLPPTAVYDPGYVQNYSPTASVIISNQIIYPDWVQDYRGDLMLIKITSVQTNIDWLVNVYGQAGDYVGTFSDHSNDGRIDFAWDLRDPNGVPRSDDSFMTVAKATPVGGTSVTQTNPPLLKVVDNYPEQGLWIVARSEYIPSNYRNYDLYTNTINGFAQLGEAGGGVIPGSPYRNSGEALFLYKQEGGTNSAALYRAFTNHNARNFYFDGHGGPDYFGYGFDSTGARRSFPASVIAQALGNTGAGTNATRYRWVWIDSCSSALGIWPQTFAMGNRENVPLTSYTSQPAAFCGFVHDVYGFDHFQANIKINSINYRSYFQLYWWAFDESIIDAFDDAQRDSAFPDAQYLKVFGYWGLGWNQYNTKAEWPPP